jgi:YD repeat-containing protein
VLENLRCQADHERKQGGGRCLQYNGAIELADKVATIVGNTYTTSWNIDTSGRRVGMTYPNGEALQYGYDGYGRLASVSRNAGGTWVSLADNFLYEPATDRRYAWRYGNGLARLVSLDLLEAMTICR